MLYAMWHASAELEGYGQQGKSPNSDCASERLRLGKIEVDPTDAHSFFLAALDQIHAHARGTLSSCNCIARKSRPTRKGSLMLIGADQTFAGSLLSSVTCSKCETTSTTIDPILDVQLDFPTDTTDPSALKLTSMLRRFCAEEKVGDSSKGYDCSSCGGGSGAVNPLPFCRKRADTPGRISKIAYQASPSGPLFPTEGDSKSWHKSLSIC